MSIAVKPAPSVEQPQTDAEYQAAVRAMFEEMEQANTRMNRRRIEIDRLEAETQAALAEISRLLAS